MKSNIYILITGVGIGVLMGLSESPVLVQILVPVLTVVASLISILTGQTNQAKTGEGGAFLGLKNISVSPIMSLIIGLVLGTFLGLFSKNFDITNRGKLFGNEVTSKSELALDSLIVKIRLLSLKQEILILEKQNEYLLSKGIETDSKGLSFDDLENIKKVMKEQNKLIEQLTKNGDISTRTSIRNFQNSGIGGASHICYSLKLCQKNGLELTKILKDNSNEEIQIILNKYQNSPDSINHQIKKYCNCK